MKIVCRKIKRERESYHYVLDIEPTEKALEKLSQLGENFYELRRGDSARPEFYQNLKSTIDILFVDGNHTTQYCFNDAAIPISLNSVNIENGIIVFHDTQMATVKIAIEKLKEHFKLETFIFPKMSIGVAKFIY